MPGKSLPTNSWTYPITNKLPKTTMLLQPSVDHKIA